MKSRALIAAMALSLGLNAVLLALSWRSLFADDSQGIEAESRPLTNSETGFQDFEIVAFAREFAERLTSFESETFRATQTAASFLMSEDLRRSRLAEVERLSEKMQSRRVVQRGRLMYLTRVVGAEDRFHARVQVDLIEDDGKVQSSYDIGMRFQVRRVSRSAQNPWGFLVESLEQSVATEKLSEVARLNERSIQIAPSKSVLLRFPCVIENVEIPKGTPLRVRLTTLDISEVQIRAQDEFAGEHVMTATCRDRAFRVKLQSAKIASGDAANIDAKELVALKALTFDDAESLKLGGGRKPRAKSAVERSIEEQLGFVIEGD